jgi:hypothetical protein
MPSEDRSLCARAFESVREIKTDLDPAIDRIPAQPQLRLNLRASTSNLNAGWPHHGAASRIFVAFARLLLRADWQPIGDPAI